CKGDPLTLTASGGTAYVWGGGEVTASISPSPTANTTYNVIVTDVNKCSNTANLLISVFERVTTGEMYRKPNN
ncbi:MAG: hypothetical protein HC830_07125, partial [Bacteroidetes bacterium]|nr:hypothetical protein [Bacteroidota bacterium]